MVYTQYTNERLGENEGIFYLWQQFFEMKFLSVFLVNQYSSFLIIVMHVIMSYFSAVRISLTTQWDWYTMYCTSVPWYNPLTRFVFFTFSVAIDTVENTNKLPQLLHDSSSRQLYRLFLSDAILISQVRYTMPKSMQSSSSKRLMKYWRLFYYYLLKTKTTYYSCAAARD